MAGYEDVLKIKKELNNGDHFGSAFAENAQYVDSLAGKLNKLKEVWVGIFQTVFNDNSIKGMLDGLIAVSEVVADVVSALDQVGLAGPVALGGLVGGFGLLKNLVGKGSSSFIRNAVEDMLDLNDATGKVDNNTKKVSMTSKVLGKAWEYLFGSKTTKGAETAAKNIDKVGKASKLSVAGLKGMAKGFWANLSIGTKFGLVGTAIAGVAVAVDYASKALDRQYAKLKESTTAQEKEINQLESKKTSLQGIQEEYDALYNKSNRTTEETARLLELNKQIAKIMPELVSGYDAEGNPILDMKGDVSSLIAEMEKGIETKKRLLSAEQHELAKNSIKQLDNAPRPTQGSHMATYKEGEVQKLLGIEQRYNIALESLHTKRDRLEAKMLKSTGDKREKLARKLQRFDDEIIKQQQKLSTEYATQLKKVQEYSDNIGKGIFSSIESGYSFSSYSKELQNQVRGLKDVLDFSDIQSEDHMYQAQSAIMQMAQAASYGQLDLGKLKESLSSANAEFAKTQDAKAYAQSISALVDQVHAVTGIDKDILTDIFKGLPPALKNAETSLDGFMNKFGKSTSDLQNKSDKVAQAVKKQYDAIQRAAESIKITGNADIDYKTAVNIMTDQDLPNQVRDMVRTLINKGFDSSEVIEVAQKLLVDMSDGEVDIESFQKMLDQQFGEGAYEITPELFVNAEIEEAQIQETMNKVQNTFGEIPTEIETLIKTNSLTAEADINRVMSMYQLCPDEVLTLIETQGETEAYNTITKLMEQYNNVPIDIKTTLRNNGVESVSQIVELNNIYESLPKEIQTYIEANGYEALINAKNIEDVLANIPPEVLVDIIAKSTGGENVEAFKGILDKLPPEVRTKVEAMVNGDGIDSLANRLNSLPISKEVAITIIKGLAENNIDAVMGAINSLPPEKRLQVIAAVESALGKISTVDQKKIKEKIAKVKAETQNALSKVNTVDKKKIANKNFHVKAEDKATGVLGTVKSMLRGITSKTITVTSVFKTVGNVIGNIFKKSIEPDQGMQNPLPDGPMPINDGPMPVNDALNAPNSGDTPSLFSYGDLMKPHKFGLDPFIELENQIKKIVGQLEVLDETAEKAMGINKINYLKKQIDLFKQQQRVQKQLEEDMKRYQSTLKNFLSGKGFGFDADGNITNYHTKLVAMEEEYERLEEAAKKASDASSEYKGDNEKERDRLSKNAKDAQDKASKYKENLDEIKKAMDKYVNLTFTEIPKIQQEWEELNNKIEDNLDSIEELNRTQKLFEHQNKVQELEYEYDKLADKLNIVEIKLKHAYGKDKLNLINQQIALMEKQQKVQQEMLNSYQNMAKVYREDLSKYGFKFDENGDITNLDETLNSFKNSKDLEKVNKLVKDYIEIQRDELPKVVESYEKLESEIKDLYEEQLNITQDIESKLTEVYKKQVEERKKLIDKELDKRLEALDKQKKAYNEAREEEDYEKDYNKQLSVIEELEEKIKLLSNDTSLSGKKKLDELLNKLKEEQEKLDEMVQDKIDSDTNKKFDEEADKLEEEADKIKEELEDKFSEDKLQQIVKDALTSGVFVDIDGNIKDLESTLLEFEDKFGDGMTAIGGVIKSELIANLNIAKDTIKDLNKILGELDIKKYNAEIVGYSELGRNVDAQLPRTTTPTVNFNSPLVNIEGNVDNNVMKDLEKFGTRLERQITDNILNSMR